MNSNLDVWAIQYYPEELETALEQVKDGLSIIYSNLKSSLNLNGMKIKTRKFDTALYNEESNVLILLMRGGYVTKDAMIDYLEKKHKRYVEVTFERCVYDYKDGDNIPELWFSREKNVLCDALEDSIKKNIYDCEFYPALNGHLDLGYISNLNTRYKIDGRIFKGLIRLEDKLILIINQVDNIDEMGISRNMNYKDILETLKSYGLSCKVNFDQNPDLYVNNFSNNIKKLKLEKDGHYE